MKKIITALAFLILMPVSLAQSVVVDSPSVYQAYPYGYYTNYNYVNYNNPVQTRAYEKYVPVYESVPYTRYFCMNNGVFYQYTEEQASDNCFYQVVNEVRVKEYKKVKYYAPYYGNTYNTGYYTYSM